MNHSNQTVTMKIVCHLIVLMALCGSVQSGRSCTNVAPVNLWDEVLVLLTAIFFMIGFLVTAAIQEIVGFINLNKKLEYLSKKWNIPQQGNDVGKFFMGFTIVNVTFAVFYKSPNQNDIENKIDNVKDREEQKLINY